MNNSPICDFRVQGIQFTHEKIFRILQMTVCRRQALERVSEPLRQVSKAQNSPKEQRCSEDHQKEQGLGTWLGHSEAKFHGDCKIKKKT